MQESEKPQHPMLFPGTQGFSSSSWCRYGHPLPSGSQGTSTRLIFSRVCDTNPVAWVCLIISNPSSFTFQITRFLKTLKRLSGESLPLPGKAQGWEGWSFADSHTAGKQLIGVTSLGPSQLTPEITACLIQALHSARSFSSFVSDLIKHRLQTMKSFFKSKFKSP